MRLRNPYGAIYPAITTRLLPFPCRPSMELTLRTCFQFYVGATIGEEDAILDAVLMVLRVIYSHLRTTERTDFENSKEIQISLLKAWFNSHSLTSRFHLQLLKINMIRSFLGSTMTIY
jgi:hypothetical protein